LKLRVAVIAVLIATAALAACNPRGHERAEARFVHAGRMHTPTSDTGTPVPAPPETRDVAGAEGAVGRTPEDAAGEVVHEARLPARGPDGDEPRPAAAPPEEVNGDPDRFLGRSPRQLEAELGAPALVRRENPAEIWQYRGPACVLDLFLYPKDGGPDVVHLEARDLSAEPMAAETCLQPLLRERAATGAG
jgi:hypothetical protein